MIQQVLETIIPADSELGMPAASEISFEGYLEKFQLASLAESFLGAVEAIAVEKFSNHFSELNYEDRLTSINHIRISNIRLFSDFLTHTFRAYYSHPVVLRKIGSGAIPPFPAGNVVEPVDFNLLESVRKRAPMFRNVEEELKHLSSPLP